MAALYGAIAQRVGLTVAIRIFADKSALVCDTSVLVGLCVRVCVHMCVLVCACAHAVRVCACVCVCLFARVLMPRACVYVLVCACAHAACVCVCVFICTCSFVIACAMPQRMNLKHCVTKFSSARMLLN